MIPSFVKVTLLSLLAAGYALGAADSYATATDGQPLAGPALDHTGDYIVPAPAELASVSAFKIRYGIGRTEDGRKVLGYQLPDLIAGPKKPVIVLTQSGPSSGGFIPFENNRDHANCRVLKKDITCFVLYPGMDTTGSEEAVRDQFAGSPDLDLRLKLAQVFSADPKGVLRITAY